MSKVWDIVVGHALFITVVVAMVVIAIGSEYLLYILPPFVVLALIVLYGVWVAVFRGGRKPRDH
jgi:hypothetical protein